jgi:transcriptional activator SPT7
LQTAIEVLEDEGLFDEEDEEDAGALAMYVFSYYVFSYSRLYRCHTLTMIIFMNSGDFADALGEDYLGLRELGIAAEFGMSSLSIPKKLLRGKKAQSKLSSTACVSPPPLF